MQVAVSMEKPSGTCFAGGGTNELELRRSLWLEAGSYYHRPKTLKPRPVRVSRFWANINEIQNRHEAGNTGMCLVGLSSGFEFLVVWGPCLGAKILIPPRDGNIRSPLYWNQPKQRCEHPTDRSYSLRAKAKDIDAAELQ